MKIVLKYTLVAFLFFALLDVRAESFKAQKKAFEKGLLAFQKKPKQALAFFKQSLVYAPQHPAILYNIALTHYKLGNKAKAIALFRKLLFQTPWDKNLKKTLTLIQPQPSSLPLWLKTPPDIVLALLFLSLLASTFLFLLRQSLKISLLCLLFGISFTGYYFFNRHIRVYATLLESTKALSAPSANAVVLFEPRESSLLQVKKQKGHWAQIVSPQKSHPSNRKPQKTGWINSHLLVFINN